MTKRFLPLIFNLFLLISSNAESQERTREYTFTAGGNVFTGFVVKHDRLMGHLSQGMTRGAELYVNKNTYGAKVWEQVFKYPDIGVSLSYFDYGSDILGETYGLNFYFDYILKRTQRFEALLKLGTGFGFHTNPYNPETNNQNVAIGSKISNSMKLRLGLNYKLTDRLKLNGSLTLSHFSVAALTQPNKGVNIATANFGASYLLNDEKPGYLPLNENYQWDQKIHYHINFNYGLKEIPPIGGPKYSVYVLSFYVSKQISKVGIVQLGMDGFSNTALKEEMEQENIDPNGLDHKRMGMIGGYEAKMNKVSVLFHFGVYVYRPYKTDQPVYQRLALKYHINDKLFLHYGFLTHFSKADHSEWGIGIKF